MKLATVDVENGDNMATLPAAAKGGHPPPASAVAGGSNSDMNTIEKNNATNKEMELKNVTAKPLQRSICILFTLHTDRTGIEMGGGWDGKSQYNPRVEETGFIFVSGF